MQNLILYAVSYLLGSIPSGLILAKIFGHVDIKKEGSKSIGATNVLRVLKQINPKLAKKLAILTVVCDVLKGVLPLIIASFLGASQSVLWTMAVLSVAGHCFSIFLGFQGGKGVATGAGVLAFFLPVEIIIALVVWFLVGKFLKISSLASLCALIALIASSFIIHPELDEIYTHAPILIIAFLVVYKHIPNIVRLLSGKEQKVV